MKLHRLELAGFGPFRDRQEVDFDAFDADGLFLISGRTGSGKSSILDGVSFALYGTVPRYDGGERRLRSDHSDLGDPTEVRLEFSTGGRRWRVTRAPEYERPAKRGGGVTIEPPRAELEEWIDGTWVGRAAKPRDVGLLLSEVVGLTAAQFQQVILLAQNQFSRFLLATGGERQAVLRTLFDSSRFEDYRDALEEWRREAQRAVDSAQAQARTLIEFAERLVAQHALGGADDGAPEGLDERRDLVERAMQRASYRRDQLGRERDDTERAAATAESALAAAESQMRLLTAVVTARRQLVDLEADIDRIDAVRARVRAAIAAEGLRAPIDTARAASAAVAAAEERVVAAENAWKEIAGDASDGASTDDANDPAHAVERLTGDIARWEAAREREREWDAAQSRAESVRTSIAAHADEYAALTVELGDIPSRRVEIEEAMAGLQGEAAQREPRARELATVSDQLVAARDRDDRSAALRDAEQAHLAAGERTLAAGHALTELLRRRLTGYAGELAAELVAGEACAVCGSRTHPHPATSSADPVSEDDIHQAERDRDVALAAETSVAAVAREARAAFADASARAGGHSIEALEERRQRATEECDAAERAAEALAAREVEREALESAARRLTERLEEVTARQRADAAALAEADATAALLRRDVDEARGDYARIDDRVAVARAVRDAARALLDARDAVAQRRDARDDAERDRDVRVAASSFETVDAVMAALMEESERESSDDEVQAHAAALAGVRARLLDLELQTVDVIDVDLDAARSDRDAAVSARRAAAGAEAEAIAIHDRLTELAAGIGEAVEGVQSVTADAATVLVLADTVAGRAPNTMKMDLETFVLAAELEDIVTAANGRLAEMTEGRYALIHSDARAAHGRASGLGIDVLDAYTARRRSPQSLSGGETFLASLALALGLAEVVTQRAGGMRLDTLFIDEGFGSLDAETLDLALATLDELRAGGRTVGVISHVETMKEQLPAQVVVEAVGDGPSRIRQTVGGERRSDGHP